MSGTYVNMLVKKLPCQSENSTDHLAVLIKPCRNLGTWHCCVQICLGYWVNPFLLIEKGHFAIVNLMLTLMISQYLCFTWSTNNVRP